jgi:hypothetical protein
VNEGLAYAFGGGKVGTVIWKIVRIELRFERKRLGISKGDTYVTGTRAMYMGAAASTIAPDGLILYMKVLVFI